MLGYGGDRGAIRDFPHPVPRLTYGRYQCVPGLGVGMGDRGKLNGYLSQRDAPGDTLGRPRPPSYQVGR
jgi:hypothetical protein